MSLYITREVKYVTIDLLNIFSANELSAKFPCIHLILVLDVTSLYQKHADNA